MTDDKAIKSCRSKKALVISPFASHPADAGHRRRVLQTTRLLRDNGYEITFVLFAFELPWYWRFDEKNFHKMCEEWGNVQIYPAPKNVGTPPINGEFHELDEWWDEGFGHYLSRLFGIKHFDAMVVHNVWLSKAFEYAPKSTIKFLETHDIFYKRGKLYEELGQAIDFYTPNQEGEIFGLDRSDVILTVTDEELELIEPLVKKPAFTIPTYEPIDRNLEKVQSDYLHPKKVTFGMLGSAHIFNILGLQALLDALETKVSNTFAPVEIIIAGDVSGAVNTRLPIKKLGYIEDETDFFNQVDFVIAPLFQGTGFKVKVADAVIYGKPILAATHAAEGTFLSSKCCFDSPEKFAQKLVNIAMNRPSLSGYLKHSTDSSNAMAKKTDFGHSLMLKSIEMGQANFLIDLSNLSIDDDLAAIVAYGSYLKPFSSIGRVYVSVNDDLLGLFKKSMMPGTVVLNSSQMREVSNEGIRKFCLKPKLEKDDSDTWHGDSCFYPNEIANSISRLDFRNYFVSPIIHPDVKWMLLSNNLKKLLAPQLSKMPPPRELVFTDGYGQTRCDHFLEGILHIDVNCSKSVSLAMAWMLAANDRGLSTIWATDPNLSLSSFVYELSILKGFRNFGGTNYSNVETSGEFYHSDGQFYFSFDILANYLSSNIA